MNNQEAEIELEKCYKSPYYFYTTFCTINGKKATTMLSEEEFNKQFTRLAKRRPSFNYGLIKPRSLEHVIKPFNPEHD